METELAKDIQILKLPLVEAEKSSDQFIVSNTKPVGLNELTESCIIPVFSKDNESTLSHPEFIQATMETVSHVFSREQILQPAVDVSGNFSLIVLHEFFNRMNVL